MKDIIRTFRRIWPYIKPMRGQLVIIFLAGLTVSGCMTLVPWLMQKLLIDVFEKRDAEMAKWIPFCIPAVYLVMGLARYFNTTSITMISERLIGELRKRIVSQFVHLNLSFHNGFEAGSGGLISRVLNDTSILQVGLTLFVDFFQQPLTAIGLLGSMIWIDWQLTALFVLALPLFAYVTRRISKSLRKYGHLNREAMEEVTSTIKESLDGVRVIQSFNLESELEKRFGENIRRYLHTRSIIVHREEAVSPLTEFLASVLVMGIIIFMIDQVFHHGASAGTFVSFLVAAGIMQPPLKRLQEAFVRVNQTVVVADRLFDLIENKSRVPQATKPKPFPSSWKKIEFRNVSFSYGKIMVLKNVNLTVQRGEVIALVGESGSGKSTLVNLLERFFDPTDGQILVDETPISDFDLKDLRHQIALVTQDVFLFRDSIRGNIHAGDFSKDPAGVEEAARLANAHSFISNTDRGYGNLVGERGGLLSGGEKQRVSIARAIFKDAPILILDEATSALDSVSEMEVQKGLNHLMQGRTAFVIAHRLSTVFNADRIVVMKKGEVVEQGSHAALLAQGGEYHQFFELQMNHGERARLTST